jgi:hypothetical protein
MNETISLSDRGEWIKRYYDELPNARQDTRAGGEIAGLLDVVAIM